MAAPQLAGVVQLADEKRKRGVKPDSGGGVGQLPTRSVAKWTPQAIDGALSAADSGNLMRAADLVETIMASDDRVSGVLSARTLGMLRLDLSFEGGSEEVRTQLEANGRADWETMHPDAELSQLMAWGIVLGVGLGQRKPLDRELGSKQMHTLETWHPRWLYQNVYTEEWRVSHKGGTSDVVAGDGQWVMYMPYGAHRPWARASWRALAFAWILKQFSLHDRARFSEVYGGPIRVGIAPAGANERMRTRWLAALKNLGRDSTLVLPPGYDLKLVEVGAGKGIDVFDQQIEWADRAIAVVLAGQIVTTEGTPGFNKGSIHETIKADTIGFTAKSTSLCLYDQSLKPSAGLWYGDVNAAPKPQWDTTLPEDQKAKVDAMQGAGLAIKTLDEVLASSGVRVNALALTDRFGIPTVTLPHQDAKAPNVQLAPTDVAKVVRVNEARAAAQLGPLMLPDGKPDPDGDLTVAQFDVKKTHEIEALFPAPAPFGAKPTAGSPAPPPPQPPGSPSSFSARLAGSFDEAKHPRADDGEFGSGGGSDDGDAHGDASKPGPAKDIVDRLTSKPIKDGDLNYRKGGMRPESRAKLEKFYEGKDPTDAAMKLDPIELYAYDSEPGNVILQDGRHRLEMAREKGADSLRARITVYGADAEEPVFQGVRKLDLGTSKSPKIEEDAGGAWMHSDSKSQAKVWPELKGQLDYKRFDDLYTRGGSLLDHANGVTVDGHSDPNAVPYSEKVLRKAVPKLEKAYEFMQRIEDGGSDTVPTPKRAIKMMDKAEELMGTAKRELDADHDGRVGKAEDEDDKE